MGRGSETFGLQNGRPRFIPLRRLNWGTCRALLITALLSPVLAAQEGAKSINPPAPMVPTSDAAIDPQTIPYNDRAPPVFSGVTMGSRQRTRDGLLLRPTLGLGATHIFRRTQTTDQQGATTELSSITAVPLEFRGLIGGALTRDVILGGFLGISQSPTATFASKEDDSLSFEEGISFQTLGLQLLYFLDSGSPWQLGGSVAFLNWSARQPAGGGQVPGGTGVLATLEAGYHFWVGPRFELGFLFDADLGATQSGASFRISEALIQSSETSFLLRGTLAVALSYY